MNPTNMKTTAAGAVAVSGTGAAPVDAPVTGGDGKTEKNWLGWRVLSEQEVDAQLPGSFRGQALSPADLREINHALLCARHHCLGCFAWLRESTVESEGQCAIGVVRVASERSLSDPRGSGLSSEARPSSGLFWCSRRAAARDQSPTDDSEPRPQHRRSRRKRRAVCPYPGHGSRLGKAENGRQAQEGRQVR